MDINRSKFYVLSCAFDGISKFGPVDPEFADLWGWVGSLRGYFWPFREIQCPTSQKKCEKMYFRELQTIEYDRSNVPESENMKFCGLLTNWGLDIHHS